MHVLYRVSLSYQSTEVLVLCTAPAIFRWLDMAVLCIFVCCMPRRKFAYKYYTAMSCEDVHRHQLALFSVYIEAVII